MEPTWRWQQKSDAICPNGVSHHREFGSFFHRGTTALQTEVTEKHQNETPGIKSLDAYDPLFLVLG